MSRVLCSRALCPTSRTNGFAILFSQNKFVYSYIFSDIPCQYLKNTSKDIATTFLTKARMFNNESLVYLALNKHYIPDMKNNQGSEPQICFI